MNSKVILSLITILGFLVLYFVFVDNSQNSPTIQPIRESARQSSIKPYITKIENRSLFMGNVFFGRYIDDWSVQAANPELKSLAKYEAKAADKRDYSYPFSKLNSFEKSKYDTWIAGLECPVTDEFVDSATQDDSLNFTCLPGYIPEAAKFFDVFTLANNHIDNMERIGGFQNTRKVLDQNNIQYFGHYDNSIKKDICEIVAIDAKAEYSDNSSQKLKIPVAYCGYHNVFKLPTRDEIDVITEFAKYFPVIVMPHQGQEYVNTSDAIKRETYRKFIDAGADLVVGDHPHATQEMEYYEGKMIVYSLGNFIFDQQFNSNVTSAITLDAKMSMFGSGPNLENYTAMAKECAIFQDNCLQQAKELNLAKPKLDFQFDIIASDNSGKITRRADGGVQTKMEQITGIRELKR